jgi:type IV pilus assembly protein PilA
MFCFKCGTSMPDTAPICPQCGARASTAPPPAASSPAAAPAPASVSPRLNVPPQRQAYPGQQETDGKAVGSLILGILALLPFLWVVAGIPAIILGHLSRAGINKSMGRLKGAGMALAGLIMGYISLAAIPILIVAAIAIPNLLKARIDANERAALSTVRTLNTTQITYSTTHPPAGYAPDLATLGPGPSGTCQGTEGPQKYACLLDGTLGCASASWCAKGGYKYSVTGYTQTAVCNADGICDDYVVVATPLNYGATGSKSFCSTSDAVIRFRTGASLSAPPTVAECQSWRPL